jgi:hypothetical protein
MTFEYRLQLQANWQDAKGFLVKQFESFLAQLLPIQPLLNLVTPYTPNSSLVTDPKGNPSWGQPQPIAPQIQPAQTFAYTLDPLGNYLNWLPPNWDNVAALLLTTTTNATIGSLAIPGTLTGVFKLLTNVSQGATITLRHKLAAAAPGTSFRCPNNTDYVIGPGGGVQVWYDVTNRDWQVCDVQPVLPASVPSPGPATDGQLLIGRTSDGSLRLNTLSAGAGISVTNAAAGITITNTAPAPPQYPVLLWNTSGSSTATAGGGLVTATIPPLNINDHLRVILQVFQNAQPMASGLLLAVPGVVSIVRLDDINGGSLGTGAFGQWEILLQMLTTGPSFIQALVTGSAGTATVQTGATRFASANNASLNWTAGFSLQLFSPGQTAGGTTFWTMKVIRF